LSTTDWILLLRNNTKNTLEMNSQINVFLELKSHLMLPQSNTTLSFCFFWLECWKSPCNNIL